MTRVRVTTYRGCQELPLELALSPEEVTPELFGRLLAALVESKALRLEDAAELAGNYADIEEIDT